MHRKPLVLLHRLLNLTIMVVSTTTMMGFIIIGCFIGCSTTQTGQGDASTKTVATSVAASNASQAVPSSGTTQQAVASTTTEQIAQSYSDLVFFPEWQKSHVGTEEGVEYVKQENPYSPAKTTVRIPGKDVMVTVTQVDSENWPIVKLYVSLTDKEGKPLQLINRNLLTVVENNYVMPKDDGIFKVETNADAPMAKKIPINIALAVDKSGSMAWDATQQVLPAEKQPIAFAKSASVNFLERLGVMDRCVVLAFDHQIMELGVNRGAVDQVNNLKASGDTALYAVLFQSAVSIREKDGAKVIILMTDGKNDVAKVNNPNVKIELTEAMQVVKDSSIPVFPIAFGAGADRAVLKTIAEESNGTYYETPDKEAIESLYQVIQSIINNQYIITYRSLSRDAVLDFVIIDGTEQHRGKEMSIPEDVKHQLEQLDEKENRLKDQEKVLGEREDAVGKKEAEQKQKDVELTKREDEVSKKEVELKDLQKTLDDLEKQIEDAKQKVEDRKRVLEGEQKSIEAQQRQLEEREQQYNKEKLQLNQREQEINKREDDLNTKEKNLTTRKQDLEERQQELDKRQKELETQKVDLDRLERQLNLQDTDLKKLRTELDGRQSDLQKQQRELETRTTRVNQQEKENTTRQTTLDKRDRELTQLRAELDKESNRLSQLEKDLNKQLTDVRNDQEVIKRAKAEIERQNKEITTKSSDMQKMKQKYESLKDRFLKVIRDLGGNVEEIEKELTQQ